MLESDFNEVLQGFYANREDQLKRRTLVRTLFATIEGTIFSLKQTALEFFRLRGVEIPPSEYAALAEETYALKENGELRIASQFIRLPANIRFAFSEYGKAMNMDFSVNVNDPKWNDLRKAIEVRNRLMHPKAPADLVVSDADIESVLNAAIWFREQIQLLIQENLPKIRAELLNDFHSSAKAR
jgi:hypothetical protein